MRAFTLVELMVVIGLFAIIAGFAVPVSISQIARNRAIDVAAEITSNMFLFQQNSYSKKDNKRYGFRINESNYEIIISDNGTIDEGDEFIKYDYPDRVSVEPFVESTDEIMFNYGSFRPSENMSFYVNYGSSSVIVEINSEGLLNYYLE